MSNFTDYIRELRRSLLNSKPISDVELKQKRVEVFQERCKNNRNQAVVTRRHMVNNTEDLEEVEEAASSTSKTMSRLERLAQWKAERQKKKSEAAKKMKPIFKVYALSTPIGLPDLENVNRQIKGKLIDNEKSSFASKNHQFKPPANIKPIYLNSEIKDRSTRGDLASGGVRTRAQTAANIDTKENIANVVKSFRLIDNEVPLQRKLKKRSKNHNESPETVGIAAEVREAQQGLANKRIRPVTRAQTKALKNLHELQASAENTKHEKAIKTEQVSAKILSKTSACSSKY